MESVPPTTPPAPNSRRVIKRITRQDRRGLFYIVAGVIAVYGFIAYLFLQPAEKVLPGRATALAGGSEVKGNYSAQAILYTKDGTMERQYTVDITGKIPGVEVRSVDEPETRESHGIPNLAELAPPSGMANPSPADARHP